ncbi:MAG TPA: GNAT family N-acetyltransferase [Kofleriaceae bacterium]|jgi:GNAT superfamily N-acetyltransferase
MFFSLDYVERATLQDGTEVVLRLLAPEDKVLLREGFERLSPASRYARFLAPKHALTDEELRYLCEIDQRDHFAIGAIRADDATGLGIARFIRLPNEPRTAEAAIAVADEVQGRGLGKLLFLRLVAAAAERDVDRFRCELLGTNVGMAALLAGISPDRTVEAAGGVLTIEAALPHVAPAQPAAEPPPDGPMYKLLRAAAANAIEWTEAVRRFWRR